MSLALRVAIALHPATWREKHADAVLGTLMDVADESGGRIPLTETLNLGLRGLWLRARGSVTFWAGLVIMVVMVVGAATVDLYQVDGSLTAHLLKLNGGLSLAVIVLGGWTGARARVADIDVVGARLRRLAADSVPPLVVTAVACLIAFVVVCVRFGVPWMAGPTGLVIFGHAVFVIAALAIGELLGAALPRVLVIFVAPAAVAIFMLFSGAALDSYQGLAYIVDVAPFIRLYAMSGIVIALAIVTATIRPLWARAVPALAFIGACAWLVMAVPASGLGGSTLNERPLSELICSRIEPVVCLWPEQDAVFGASLRTELSEAYATGAALGLPVDDPAPHSVARYAMTGIPAPDCEPVDGVCAGYPASNFGLGVSGLAPDDVMSLYASSFTYSYWEQPTVGESQLPAVQFAVAIVLGVDRDKAWPGVPDPYTGERLFDPVGIPDEATAHALVERWLTVGVNGVRSPD